MNAEDKAEEGKREEEEKKKVEKGRLWCHSRSWRAGFGEFLALPVRRRRRRDHLKPIRPAALWRQVAAPPV